MVYQEKTQQKKTYQLTCDPITFVKHFDGA